MKKQIIMIAIVIMAISSLRAQSVTDASRYGGTAIMGTARYMGMAGSFGALGGDPSAIIDNPGALGIYRSGEISFTLNPSIVKTQTRSNSGLNNGSDFKFNFNNASIVFAIPSGKEKGYVSSNFSFTYNRLKDYTRTVNYRSDNREFSMGNVFADLANGFYGSELVEDNIAVPYLAILGYETFLTNPIKNDSLRYLPYSKYADHSVYKGIESGRVEEYNLSYAMNIGHRFYLGIGVGIQSLYYHMASDNGEMYNNVDGTNSNMILSNSFTAAGTGANFRAGFILRATDFLRLGASIQTPTYYSINEYYTGRVSTEGMDSRGGIKSLDLSANNLYKYNSPLRFQASAAFIIGKTALINVDYQLSDFNSTMKFRDSSSDFSFGEPAFTHDNEYIKRYGQLSHLLKIGGEFRIASTYSIRAGFAYQTANVSPNVTRAMMDNTTRMDLDYYVDKGSLYGAIGFGYRYNGFGIDIAYLYQNSLQGFSTFQQGATLNNGYYEVVEPSNIAYLAKVTTHTHNIVLTLLYKF